MYKEGDVEQVLLRLGIDADQRNDELIGYCPMHLERVGREDSHPSWSINAETGVHHCFSCGYKGTLIGLVADVNGFTTEWNRYDFEAAKAWLRANIEIDFELMAKQLEELRNAYIPVQRPVDMGEARLGVFTSPPEWALNARGLSLEACSTYGVRWDKGREAWIAPIRDAATHKLIGWQEKGQSNRLFRNRPAGVAKSRTLFGFNGWAKTMIVVESPLDAVRLASVGITGGVATFGASVSDSQLNIMRSCDQLIIAMDNPKIDKAGEKSSKDLFKRAMASGLEFKFFSYGDSGVKDIGDMDEHMIRLGLQNAKHCVFGEAAVYA